MILKQLFLKWRAQLFSLGTFAMGTLGCLES